MPKNEYRIVRLAEDERYRIVYFGKTGKHDLYESGFFYDSLDGLKEDLRDMLKALDKPVMDEGEISGEA